MYKCWSCKRDLQNLIICEECRSAQPLSITNAFESLGLPAQFDIDLKHLSDHYLERQNLVHPDKFILKSSEEKLYAHQNSSYINQCYQELKDSILRAEALLKYHNNPCDDAENTIQDPALLYESMAHREKLMLIDSINELLDFRKEIVSLTYTIEQDLKQALDVDKDFDTAKKLILRLKYLKKLQTEITQKEVTYS